MFGFLQADRTQLTEAEDLRYTSAYCGLCRNIRQRYGQLSGAVLSYDLCFLVLLLQSLYEEEEHAGDNICLRHPRNPRHWWQCGATDYAADMNIALSYLKLRDDWQDDGRLLAWGAAQTLRRTYEQVSARYPRQCTAIEQGVSALRILEKENAEAPDAAAQTCADFMSEIFAWRNDRWRDCLRQFGAALGRCLYVADAAADLNRDALLGRYNPFRRYYGCKDNEQRFREMLKMLLGDCLYWFDKLPLVTDVGIMKNILCFGLWTEFDRSYGKEYADKAENKNGNE